jgi:hypothetical protein
MATSSHVWKFFRIGGLDQVAIETADDLLNLKHLDQKLWVALSCPVKGLELDEKTLGLIDADKDGRIRVPELLAAIDWAADALRNPVDLLRGTDSLPLTSLNEGTALGKALLASAKELLGGLGQSAAAEITLDQAQSTAKVYAATTLNGDGVIVPDTAKDTRPEGGHRRHSRHRGRHGRPVRRRRGRPGAHRHLLRRPRRIRGLERKGQRARGARPRRRHRRRQRRDQGGPGEGGRLLTPARGSRPSTPARSPP